MSDDKSDEVDNKPQIVTSFSEVHEIHAHSGRTIKTQIGVNVMLLGVQDGSRPLLSRVGLYQTLGEGVRPIFVLSPKAARELSADLARFADVVEAAEAERERRMPQS